MSVFKCNHKNVARDDNIWTCTSCGTVVKDVQMFMGEHSNEEYIPKFKRTLGKNEIRSKSYMLFRDNRSWKEIEEKARAVGVKYIKQTGVNELVEKIRKLEISPKEKTLVELRQIAKTKGIKRINSYSKNELVERLARMSLE